MAFSGVTAGSVFRNAVIKGDVMPQFVLRLSPDLPGEEFLDDVVVDQFPCVLGRHPECDFQVNLPFISRHHCSLFLHEGQVWVQDLNSRNGTAVNDREALRPQVLQDGDQLRLASVAFHVALTQAAEDPASGLLVGGGREDHTYTS
jgi:pSer/pThr/pTyr-binding forkhead associated (FHA) protein